jgi:hypothetical protein
VIIHDHLQRLAQVVTCHRQKYRTKSGTAVDVYSTLSMFGPDLIAISHDDLLRFYGMTAK